MKYFGFILVFVGLSGSLFGAETLQISASVDQEQVRLGERLSYRIKISGEEVRSVPSPKLPQFRGKFNVTSSSESTSIQIVNGQMASSITKRYSLAPIKKGHVIIDPATVTFKGKTYKTNSIQIEVLEAKAATASSPQAVVASGQRHPQPAASSSQLSNIFLQSNANKKTVFVGEQVIFYLNFYRRIRLWSNLSHEEPSFDGFWVEKLETKQEEQIRNLEGRRYYVFELAKKALFPLQPGTYQISGARVGFVVNPFEGQQILEGSPVSIEVLPLPLENKPENFSGIVGDFSVSMNSAMAPLQVNKPTTLQIELIGEGNLRSVSDLSFDVGPELAIYKSKVEDDIKAIFKVQGTRTFEYIVVPRVEGEFEIPSFKFNFFSPSKKQYVEVETYPIQVSVEPGIGGETGISLSGAKNGEKSEVKILAQDIHYLKSVDISNKFLYAWESLFFLLFAGGTVVAFFGLILIHLRRRLFKKDRTVELRQKAFQIAARKVKMLCAEMDAKPDAVSQLQNVLLEFLGNKTGRSFLGLTQVEIRLILEEHQIPDAVSKEVVNLLDELSFAAYAPASTSAEKRRDLGLKMSTVIKSVKRGF
ncbi:MAG: hypothetical protein ACI9BD_000225 [Candidatus Marinamargulisbacteria bacterium]